MRQTKGAGEKLRSDEKHETGHDARCAELTGSAASQLKIGVTEPHGFAYAKTEQCGSCRGGYRLPPELGGWLHSMDRRDFVSHRQSDRFIMRRTISATGAAVAAGCLGWAGWQLIRMSKLPEGRITTYGELEVVPARPPLRSSVSGGCAVAGFKLS